MVSLAMLIVLIVLAIFYSLFLLWGSLKANFGEKYFRMRKKYFPFLLFYKSEQSFAKSYRAMIIFALIFSVIALFLVLLAHSRGRL